MLWCSSFVQSGREITFVMEDNEDKSYEELVFQRSYKSSMNIFARDILHTVL